MKIFGFPARGSSARSNPFNSLFGRMALISLVVLFAVQACWFAVQTVRGQGYVFIPDPDGVRDRPDRAAPV
ncbi:hypothetical protein [Caballeronia sp. M23-90]